MVIYAIGDIHGQHRMLCSLLEQLDRVPLMPEDRLLFLGDYVDRGENSCAVVEQMLELQRRRPNTIFLRGNHEQLMLDARNSDPPLEGPDSSTVMLANATLLWFQNGGVETLLSYQASIPPEELLEWWKLVPDAHWEFLEATQLEFVTERYHFVHAGLLPPGKTWEHADMELDCRLWIREPFLSSRHDFDGRVVVFGHTPQKQGRPLVKKNKIGLDTGAVFGGPLTAAALDLESRQRIPAFHFFQAENDSGIG